MGGTSLLPDGWHLFEDEIKDSFGWMVWLGGWLIGRDLDESSLRVLRGSSVTGSLKMTTRGMGIALSNFPFGGRSSYSKFNVGKF